MKISVHFAWLLLLFSVLLMSAAVIYFRNHPFFVEIILGLSALKFLLVAFQFMDMKKSNIAWKVILVLFVLTISTAIALMR